MNVKVEQNKAKTDKQGFPIDRFDRMNSIVETLLQDASQALSNTWESADHQMLNLKPHLKSQPQRKSLYVKILNFTEQVLTFYFLFYITLVAMLLSALKWTRNYL